MKNLLILLAFFISLIAKAQSVSINSDGSTAVESAILEVKSTTKGFLPPRMTTAERNAISTPATGLVIFNTTSNALNIYFSGAWFQLSSSAITGSITTLATASPTNNGTLISGNAASGVSSVISYTGGNGENYTGQTVTSTDVTGLTATLSAYTFAIGAGTLTYNITGTPASAGTASFALNVGGQTGTITRTVAAPFNCGTSTITFTYNGNLVTYGTVVGRNNKCWLDRNLGATQVAISSTDPDSYGDLFQWGRGDDGHQLRTSNTTATLSSTDVPSNALFISTGVGGNYNWRSPENNNLWQGVNGVNNPCPTGFKVPSESDLSYEAQGWSPNSNAVAGGFASTLKISLGGLRTHTGSTEEVGVYGNYWTSTVDSTNSKRLTIRANEGPNWNVFNRTRAASIRCIKD